jgi:hypothetical protein
MSSKQAIADRLNQLMDELEAETKKTQSAGGYAFNFFPEARQSLIDLVTEGSITLQEAEEKVRETVKGIQEQLAQQEQRDGSQ